MARVFNIHQPGSHLTNALGEGLKSLAQHKLGQLNERHQQQRTSTGLQALQQVQQGAQLTPELSNSLSQLSPDLLKEYVKGTTNPKQALVNQQIGVGSNRPALTPAQQKHRDMIRNSYEINQNLVETTDRMLQALKEGNVETGLISSLYGQYLPSELNAPTGIFNKDAANVLTWTTEGQRGLQSKYRIQQTQKGKAGLEQSPEVNEHVLKDINRRAKHNLKNFQNDYPGFNLENADNYDYKDHQPMPPLESSSGKKVMDKQPDAIDLTDNDIWAGENGEREVVMDEQPDAADLPDNAMWTADNGEREIVKDGQWMPY